MKTFFVTLIAFTLGMNNLFAQDNYMWSHLLQKHVDEAGKVDYKGFIDDSDKLDIYLKSLSEFPWDRVRLTKEGAMSIWINAYNAFTIKLIIDNNPLQSITDLNKDGQSPWDRDFILMSGKKISLNHIEHEILRKQFKDPRIHFALNCASISCPKLINTAYTAENLDSLLEKGAKEYINNPMENSLNPVKTELSQIFDWYGGDFIAAEGSLVDFLNKYSKTKLSNKTTISYKEYNWDLNEQ